MAHYIAPLKEVYKKVTQDGKVLLGKKNRRGRRVTATMQGLRVLEERKGRKKFKTRRTSTEVKRVRTHRPLKDAIALTSPKDILQTFALLGIIAREDK